MVKMITCKKNKQFSTAVSFIRFHNDNLDLTRTWQIRTTESNNRRTERHSSTQMRNNPAQKNDQAMKAYGKLSHDSTHHYPLPWLRSYSGRLRLRNCPGIH
jgi:hypothetical protein